MAQSVTKITDLRTEIQSKAQDTINELKEKTSTTTEATQAGSTETPTVTDTPKVTQTAKAMPTREVTPVSSATINQTTQSVSRPNITDLLTPRTTTIKKAETPDLLSSARERLNITPLSLNLLKAAKSQSAKEAVDKTLKEQYSYWFNEVPKNITNKV
jgi:hypothetical protein